jgi:hypothetical protein
MPILEQIQENTITTFRFTSCEDDDVLENINEVVGAIKKNLSILSVHVVDDFVGCVRNDARSVLIAALGKMPSLQEDRLNEQGLLMVVDIPEVLCEVNGLKVLVLKNFVLQGTEEAFDATEMTLKQHPAIEEFSLDGCKPARVGTNSSLEKLKLTGKEQSHAYGSILAQPNPPGARSA